MTLERDCITKTLIHCEKRVYCLTIAPTTWRGKPAYEAYCAYTDANGTHVLRNYKYEDLSFARLDHQSSLNSLRRLGTVETVI